MFDRRSVSTVHFPIYILLYLYIYGMYGGVLILSFCINHMLTEDGIVFSPSELSVSVAVNVIATRKYPTPVSMSYFMRPTQYTVHIPSFRSQHPRSEKREENEPLGAILHKYPATKTLMASFFKISPCIHVVLKWAGCVGQC